MGPAAPPAAPAAPAAAAAGAPRVERDVVYGRAGGEDLRLDVLRPAGDGPFPAVLLLHGGGWQRGGRADLEPTARTLVSRGYVAASADYRLAPRFRFPAPVEDVSCAVRFLRTRASAWHLDPARIAVWGDGEGGHLALLVALLGPKDGFDGMGGHAEASRAVAAAVAFGAPSALGAWSAWRGAEPYLQQRYGKGSGGLLVDFLGTGDRGAAVFAAASPLTWVSAGDPPVLSVHGEQDPVVPFEQAKTLHARLAAVGVRERLVAVAGGGHGFAGAERARVETEALAFLDATLAAGDAAAAKSVDAPPDDVEVLADLVYARPGGTPLHLDLARPATRTSPRPVVVCFHPGPYTPTARADLLEEVKAWARAGYAAVTVEYRGPVKGAYPTPVDDGRAALRACRDQAAAWGIDPTRILVSGAKLGGWVALHLALAPVEGTPRPRGAIVRYAPVDLTDTAFVDNPTVGRLREVLVGSARPAPDLLRRASPLTYVSRDDPPVLLFHHPKDRAIPYAQSERLVAAYRTAGLEATLDPLTGSGHGAERVPQTPADAEDAKRVATRSLEFARHILGD
ncbi:MAG: alpha/beta hydrolase fold domain-containing protein [Planctomycetota bacterium]